MRLTLTALLASFLLIPCSRLHAVDVTLGDGTLVSIPGETYFDATTAFQNGNLTGGGLGGGSYGSGNTWGAQDTSAANDVISPNIIEGQAAAPELQFTLTGLAANTEYTVDVVHLNHAEANQNWGMYVGGTSGSLTDRVDALTWNEGIRYQNQVNNSTVQLVSDRLKTTYTSDASGNLNLFINRNTGVRTFLDGVTVTPTANLPKFDPLPIVNGSFEDDVLASGGFTDTDPTGWIAGGNDTNSSPRTGVIHEARSEVNDTPDGDQMAHVQGTGAMLGQRIGDLSLLDREILVEYAVTKRSNESTDITHAVHLIAGDALTFDGGDILATEIVSDPLPNNDSFLPFNLSLTATGNTAFTDLWLVFENQNGGQLHIDGVSASVEAQTVPEPAGIFAWSLGMAAIFVFGRRKQRPR